MTVAVTLLTCDRFAYTAQTVETFAAHNDVRRFLLLHADDASTETDVLPFVASYGFETVSTGRRRCGAQEMRRRLVRAAAARGADWVLMLENDWESDRPFPWPALEFVAAQASIYSLRLLGAFKERGDTRPFFPFNMAKARAAVHWAPLDGAPEPLEVADIHYGSPPNVTRMAESLFLHEAPSDRDAGYLSAAIPKLTARVVTNVFYHIGQARTPGFIR